LSGKSAESSEILSKIVIFDMIERSLQKLYNILIFRLPLALNKHRLKMPVLANTPFGPQFSISQHFDILS